MRVVRFRVTALVLASAALLLPLLANHRTEAHDWPQWRGPERTAISPETGLLKDWPDDGPPLVWKAQDLGGGYSMVAVANGRIFGMSFRGGKAKGDEVVWALDAETGKEVWNTPIAKANTRIGHGEGSRCTPTTDGDVLYALGVSGDLVCLDIATGKKRWQRNFVKDFKGSVPSWGYSESPLVEGDMIIATPGGANGTMAAFDKKTGKTIWTSKDPGQSGGETAGYASPIAFTVGGVRQIATFTSRGGIGVRAKDGKFLWRYNKPANGTANIATPIYHDSHVFFSSDYGTGGGLVKVEPAGSVEEVYFNRNMKNHHGGVVLVDEYLYGASSSLLTCMKFDTGEIAWQNRSVGKASLCYADGHLYVFSQDGVMGLVEATPAGYKEKSRFKIPDRSNKHSWSHPVVANGRLYIRDQETLLCYDVKQH